MQVFPNPFNSTATIRYHLKKSTFIMIELYDCRGCLLKKLLQENAHGGDHALLLDDIDLPSGTYIIRLQVDDGIAYRRLVCLK